MNRLIQWQTMSGERVRLGNIAVMPQAQALIVRWPNGGWVWNRPLAVVIEQDQQTRRVPIIDVTRWVQLGLLAAPILFGLIMWLKERRQ